MTPYLIAIFICTLIIFFIYLINAVKDYTVYKSNEHIKVPYIVTDKAYHINHKEYNGTFICEAISKRITYPYSIQLNIIVIKDNTYGLTFGDRTYFYVNTNTTVRPKELSNNDKRLLKIIKD